MSGLIAISTELQLVNDAFRRNWVDNNIGKTYEKINSREILRMELDPPIEDELDPIWRKHALDIGQKTALRSAMMAPQKAGLLSLEFFYAFGLLPSKAKEQIWWILMDFNGCSWMFYFCNLNSDGSPAQRLLCIWSLCLRITCQLSLHASDIGEFDNRSSRSIRS